MPREGLGGLDDRPKPGRPRTIDELGIVQATLEPPPERLGVTHWSTRLLADQLGVSNYTIARVWPRWGLKPWRTETFKFSTDPSWRQMATGKVTDACYRRHRSDEFLRFLKHVAKAYPRIPRYTSWSTTTPPTKPQGHRLAGPQPPLTLGRARGYTGFSVGR